MKTLQKTNLLINSALFFDNEKILISGHEAGKFLSFLKNEPAKLRYSCDDKPAARKAQGLTSYLLGLMYHLESFTKHSNIQKDPFFNESHTQKEIKFSQRAVTEQQKFFKSLELERKQLEKAVRLHFDDFDVFTWKYCPETMEAVIWSLNKIYVLTCNLACDLGIDVRKNPLSTEYGNN